MSRYYWSLPGIEGTVWGHYMLVATQWPTRAFPIDPYNDGGFFPATRDENLVNTTMETYYQDRPSSCMACHQNFNLRGRDFVGMLGNTLPLPGGIGGTEGALVWPDRRGCPRRGGRRHRGHAW